jgi:hypothetical protein
VAAFVLVEPEGEAEARATSQSYFSAQPKDLGWTNEHFWCSLSVVLDQAWYR